jgi:uncharacterized membrane protein YkoI
MNIKITHLLAALGIAALVPVTAAPALAYTGREFAHDAKIGIEQARHIALTAHPGTVTDEELEREAGGSGLRYSFDVYAGRITQEVGVDAVTGQVLENKN